MKFFPTPIAGVVRIEAEPHADDRGLFARLHCPEEFTAAGIPFAPAQTSVSRNPTAGTLRGLHYQAAPHAETKLVRVTRGRVFDVAVDLRPDSATYRHWIGAELSAENLTALFIPEGIAHGFLTLEPDTDVLYQIAPSYRPGFDAGVRWNDPAFGIAWPSVPTLISDRDAGYPDFGEPRLTSPASPTGTSSPALCRGPRNAALSGTSPTSALLGGWDEPGHDGQKVGG